MECDSVSRKRASPSYTRANKLITDTRPINQRTLTRMFVASFAKRVLWMTNFRGDEEGGERQKEGRPVAVGYAKIPFSFRGSQ